MFLPESTLITYGLLLLVGVLSVVVLVLAFSLGKIHNKLKKSQSEKTYMSIHPDEQVAKILADAEAKSIQIIETATQKANNLLTQATQMDNAVEQNLIKDIATLAQNEETSMDQMGQLLLNDYKKSFLQMQSETINQFRNITKSLETEAVKEVDTLRKALQMQTVSSQKLVDEKIQKEYEEVKGLVAVYKEAEMKKVDTEVIELLQKVTKEILGKTLSLSDHQELIVEAIKQARRKLTA